MSFHDILWYFTGTLDDMLGGDISFLVSPRSSRKSQPEINYLPPTKNAGVLDTLPLEMLRSILHSFDLRSLVDFRRVNRRAAYLVDSLFHYQVIKRHAPNALRGILRIETSWWITCLTLYEKLCTKGCEVCGDFGGYLYLLTCKRVCFRCFTQDDSYLPLSPGLACRKFGLNSQTVKTLPHMKVVPGKYTPPSHNFNCSTRIWPPGPQLIDYDSAVQAGISLHGSSTVMERHVSNAVAQREQAYQARLDAAAAAQAQQPEAPKRRVRRPARMTPRVPDAGVLNPLRFVAIVHVPWFNKSSHEAEWGFYCTQCHLESRSPKFTAASFDEHLERLGGTQSVRDLHVRVPV